MGCTLDIYYQYCILIHSSSVVCDRVHAFLDGDPTGWWLRMEPSPGIPDSEITFCVLCFLNLYVAVCHGQSFFPAAPSSHARRLVTQSRWNKRESCFLQTFLVWDGGISITSPLSEWSDYLCVCKLLLCLNSLFGYMLSSVSLHRADALAGVRRQGCESLTRAYCMVGRP